MIVQMKKVMEQYQLPTTLIFLKQTHHMDSMQLEERITVKNQDIFNLVM